MVTVALGTAILRLGLPLLLAGGGVAAFVSAPDANPAAFRSHGLWIDSPIDGGSLDAGDVTVVAHAGDGLEVTELRLEVDGARIATSKVETFGRLATASFVWKATDGFHALAVFGSGEKSALVTVSVGNNPELAIDSSPEAPAEVGETTTTVTGETTTTPSTSPNTPGQTTVAPATTDPGASDTTTTAKPPPPAIGAGQILANGPYGSTVCGDSAGNPSGYTDIRVTVTGSVTSAQVRLFNDATGTVSVAPSMSRSGDTYLGRITWNSTLKDSTNTTVSVVANGPGGSDTKQIGVITIVRQCPKD